MAWLQTLVRGLVQSGFPSTPDPAAYVETQGYTDDFKDALDLSDVVAAKALQHGCHQLIYSTQGGDRVVIMAQRGSPFARFLEALDAANYAKETYGHGTVGYKRRGIIRIPTTPGQVKVLAYMQQMEYRQAGVDDDDEVEFGFHSAGDGSFLDEADDESDVEAGGAGATESKNSDVESGGGAATPPRTRTKRRTAAQTHPDVASSDAEGMMAVGGADSAPPPPARDKGKGQEAEAEAEPAPLIDNEEALARTVRDTVRDGVVRHPEFDGGDQVLGEEELQCIVMEHSGEAFTEDMGMHIRGFMPRMGWENFVQATVDEYNLFDAFVTLGLSDALYINTLRRWLCTGDGIRTMASGGYTYQKKVVDAMSPAESLRAMGNPLVDLREFMDKVFRKQRADGSESGPVSAASDGLWGDSNPLLPDDNRRKNGVRTTRRIGVAERLGLALTAERKEDRARAEDRIMEVDDALGFSLFRQYVDVVVHEGETRMPNTTRATALMLSACNGIAALYEEAMANRAGPGQIVDSDDVTISLTKLHAIYENVRAVNDALARNIDEIAEHIKMETIPAYT